MGKNSIAVKQRYEVEMADGEKFEVTATIQDQIRWELNHKGEPFIGGPSGNGTLKMLEHCFYALRRTGQSDVKQFDIWRTRVADLLVIGEDDDDENGDDENGDNSAGDGTDEELDTFQ